MPDILWKKDFRRGGCTYCLCCSQEQCFTIFSGFQDMQVLLPLESNHLCSISATKQFVGKRWCPIFRATHYGWRLPPPFGPLTLLTKAFPRPYQQLAHIVAKGQHKRCNATTCHGNGWFQFPTLHLSSKHLISFRRGERWERGVISNWSPLTASTHYFRQSGILGKRKRASCHSTAQGTHCDVGGSREWQHRGCWELHEDVNLRPVFSVSGAETNI